MSRTTEQQPTTTHYARSERKKVQKKNIWFPFIESEIQRVNLARRDEMWVRFLLRIWTWTDAEKWLKVMRSWAWNWNLYFQFSLQSWKRLKSLFGAWSRAASNMCLVSRRYAESLIENLSKKLRHFQSHSLVSREYCEFFLVIFQGVRF